ncbi:MAG: nucleotidyltransferase domain-containing protein [Chloroflexi bacterium]|nr:MAG: nucleotidyltransferase domain-containing protein [Chloroflexota bacterium]
MADPTELNETGGRYEAPTLSEEFLNALVAELDNDDIVGIILGGSFARGEARPYSDVDIACFVRDAVKLPQKRFFYRNGRLVSVAATNATDIQSRLTNPERAFLFTAGRRRVLLDKDGSVTRLMQEIDAFNWPPLQAVASRNANFYLMIAAESAHKVLNELVSGDELALSYAVASLFSQLTLIVAIQRGVLVKSDSTYYRQIEESVGLDSIWTRYHRIAAGVDTGSADVPPLVARGIATLHLYQETANLLWSILEPPQREVIKQTVKVIEEAGLL